MKTLLLATIASSIVLASCTQANADGEFQQPQVLHNQGCYAQIDEYKLENGDADEYLVSDFDAKFIITLVYPTTHAKFSHDKIQDVCNISIQNGW